MTKHHWRQQVKTFFEKHVDQDKHEQMKENRKDMEDKKEKIIHLIKGEEQDGSNGKSASLEELVKDYHKQYESLYELYHNLTGELKKKVHRRKEEDKEKFSSSSSSDSDSDTDHSSKGKGDKNGELQNELTVEAARWDQERLQLMSENDELKVTLESSTNLGIELNQRVEELTRERSVLLEVKDSAIKRAEEAEANVVELKDTVDGLKNKTKALEEQEKALRLQLEIANNHKRETEEQLEIKAREASDQMKEVFYQLNSFQKELITLATLKASMESELERKSQEVSESLTQIGNLTEKLANTEADQKKNLEEKSSLAYLAQSLESEVESLISEKTKLGDEFRTIRTENADLKAEIDEASEKITALTGEIDRLKEELEAMQTVKTITSQLENENAELRSKVVDLELNLRSAERKAEELSRGNESNDQLLMELQTTIEDLKRDIEMDKDELMTIEEKNRNLEIMHRLSNQKLRVTEQLLSEKEEKNAALSQTLKTYDDMIREISEQTNTSLASLEHVVTKKFDEDYGGLAKSVFSLFEEIRNVKSWVVKTRMETEKVKAEGTMMKERIEKLEMEVKERVEEEEVVRMVSHLEKDVKEKEERLLDLGEEKREAIKQLCVWIEYYRCRCVELQGILVKMAPKVQRTS